MKVNNFGIFMSGMIFVAVGILYYINYGYLTIVTILFSGIGLSIIIGVLVSKLKYMSLKNNKNLHYVYIKDIVDSGIFYNDRSILKFICDLEGKEIEVNTRELKGISLIENGTSITIIEKRGKYYYRPELTIDNSINL